jgi:hypothetical protein
MCFGLLCLQVIFSNLPTFKAIQQFFIYQQEGSPAGTAPYSERDFDAPPSDLRKKLEAALT